MLTTKEAAFLPEALQIQPRQDADAPRRRPSLRQDGAAPRRLSTRRPRRLGLGKPSVVRPEWGREMTTPLFRPLRRDAPHARPGRATRPDQAVPTTCPMGSAIRPKPKRRDGRPPKPMTPLLPAANCPRLRNGLALGSLHSRPWASTRSASTPSPPSPASKGARRSRSPVPLGCNVTRLPLPVSPATGEPKVWTEDDWHAEEIETGRIRLYCFLAYALDGILRFLPGERGKRGSVWQEAANLQHMLERFVGPAKYVDGNSPFEVRPNTTYETKTIWRAVGSTSRKPSRAAVSERSNSRSWRATSSRSSPSTAARSSSAKPDGRGETDATRSPTDRPKR